MRMETVPVDVVKNVGFESLKKLPDMLIDCRSASEVVGVFTLIHKSGFDSQAFDTVAARLAELGEPDKAIEFIKMGERRRLHEMSNVSSN